MQEIPAACTSWLTLLRILPAQHPLETAPFPSFCPTLPHPNSRSAGRGCDLSLLRVSSQRWVLTLPFRLRWNCLMMQFWPHPLLQRPVNSPLKLSFHALFFLELPLIFACTVCLETMAVRSYRPCWGWANQKKAAGNACWERVPLLSPERWALSGVVTGFAKRFAAKWILDAAWDLLPPLPCPCFVSRWSAASSLVPAQLSLKFLPWARPGNCF